MAMKKSKLGVICGLKVSDSVFTDGDIGIAFENGVSLAVYNKHELIGFSHDDMPALIGKTVIRVDESSDATTVEFDSNLAIRIDMRDEAYMGPEAMQLRVPGEHIVIWN